MTDNRCNGWRNWETWKVNLHWGDYWGSLVWDNGETIDAETMRNDVEEFLEEAFDLLPEGQRLFISDMIDLSAVDWHELAAHYERESE